MGLSFKAQLQQMWSKLCAELDVTVLEQEREGQHESIWNTVFILINACGVWLCQLEQVLRLHGDGPLLE